MISHLMTLTAELKGLFVMHSINGDIAKLLTEKTIPDTDVPFNKPYLTGFEQK